MIGSCREGRRDWHVVPVFRAKRGQRWRRNLLQLDSPCFPTNRWRGRVSPGVLPRFSVLSVEEGCPEFPVRRSRVSPLGPCSALAACPSRAPPQSSCWVCRPQSEAHPEVWEPSELAVSGTSRSAAARWTVKTVSLASPTVRSPPSGQQRHPLWSVEGGFLPLQNFLHFVPASPLFSLILLRDGVWALLSTILKTSPGSQIHESSKCKNLIHGLWSRSNEIRFSGVVFVIGVTSRPL